MYYVIGVDILDDYVYVGNNSNLDITKFKREDLKQLVISGEMTVVGATIRRNRGVVFNRSSESIALLEGCVHEGDVVQVWDKHWYEDVSYCGYDSLRHSYMFRREDGTTFRVTKTALRDNLKHVLIPISL